MRSSNFFLFMRYIDLTTTEQKDLKAITDTSTDRRERSRAHALLLSAKGYYIEQLSDIFFVDRDTVARWLDRWQQSGIQSLKDGHRSGRPSKLNDDQKKVWGK